MKKSIVRIGVGLVASIVAFVIWSGIANANAASKSEAICSAITVGMTKDRLSALVMQKKGRLNFFDGESATARATGWSLMCRCTIRLDQNAVRSVTKSICLY